METPGVTTKDAAHQIVPVRSGRMAREPVRIVFRTNSVQHVRERNDAAAFRARKSGGSCYRFNCLRTLTPRKVIWLASAQIQSPRSTNGSEFFRVKSVPSNNCSPPAHANPI